MKKQILKLGLAIAVVSSTVYAFGGFDAGGPMCGGKMMNKPFMKQQGNGLHTIMSIVSDMDLSSSQWTRIRKTMLDMKRERLDNCENQAVISFKNDGSFDKEKFIKEHTALSKNMIAAQSKTIEKIISILNKSQKEILVSKLQK